MKGVYLGLFLLIFFTDTAAQTITTAQDGPWNQSSTWAGGTVPTSSNSTSIVIQHNVNVPSGYSVSIDQAYVDMLATLTIDAGGTVTVADDGTGSSDLDLYNDGIDYGYLTVNGTLILNNSAIITGTDQGNANFNSGSVFRHLYTATEGSLPVANWDANSTVQIQGYTGSITASAGGNWSQNFGNFTFNCSSLGSGIIQMQGLLINVNDLTVSSTGSTGSFRLATTQNPTINIARDLTISGTSRVVFNTTGASTVINIGRDFIYNSTNSTGSTTNSTGTTTFNVTRDFTMNASGGQLILASGAGAGSGTINLTGNFTLSAGTITESSSSTGVGSISFLAGSHTFSNSGTISNSINFNVNNSATLSLGTSAITGAGSFTLSPSSILQVGSIDTNGAIQTGSTAGNIRNTGSRTYDASSTIVYNGLGAQKIGNGFPTNVNLEINNSSGVTNNNVGVTNVIGNLTLTSGPLYIGSSNTLNVQSNFYVTGGSIGGSSTSNLTFSGSGSLATLTFYSGSESLNNLTLTRIANLTLGSNLTIGGTLDLSGGNLDFSGRTLTINGGSITSSGTGLKSNSTSNLIFGGSTFSSSVPFSGTGNQLNNLTFGTGGGAYTWSSGVTINGTLTLSAGALTHSSGLTMAANSTFIKGSGTISGSAPSAAGSYNVTYNGTGNTGLELPTSSTALRNLTIDASGGTVTLQSGITINGNFDVANGTFAVGANSINMKGSTWSSSGGTFSAGTGTVTFSGTGTGLSGSTTFNNMTVSGVVTLSSATTTFTGNISNGGTVNSGSGTVVFSGTTAMTGAGTTSFNDVTVSGTLTAPSGTLSIAGDFTNSGTFNHNNGTVVFNGTTTFAGTAPSFFSVSITGTLTAPTTLNVAGNLSNSGTFNANSGTLVLNGTVSAQAITGTLNVNHLNISNPTGVNNNGTVNLSGTLTMISTGKFDADGSSDGGTLVVRSTGVAAGGRIAALPDPTKFTGNVTVERFIDGNHTDYWRLLSMPITNGTVATWKANFPVSGSFSDPSPGGGVNNVYDNTRPSIYYWDNSAQNWAAVSGTSTSATSLSNTVGYTAYTYYTSNFTVSMRGTIGKGAVTSSISSQSGDYALVPNPYPSPIDWDNFSLGGNIDSYMSLRNTDDVLSYYQQGTGIKLNPPTPSWTGEVATGQSFWIQSLGASSITFQESYKATNDNYYFLREKQTDNYFKIALTGNGQSDEMAIIFMHGATAGRDPLMDAGKLRNGMAALPGQKAKKYVNLSSYNEKGGQDFAINAISPLSCNTAVKLMLTDVSPGTYTFSFAELDRMKLGYSIVIVDKFTKRESFVSGDFKYSFEVTSDSTSFGGDRFEVRFLVPGSPYLNSLVPPALTITDGCQPASLPLKLTASSGVSYQILLGEIALTEPASVKNTGDIEFIIPKDKLSEGQNSLSIVASINGGCETIRYENVISYQMTPIPLVTLEKSGSYLLTNFDTDNEWTLDGVSLGQTGRSIVATTSGTYQVRHSVGECAALSPQLIVTPEEIVDGYMSVFPNPVADVASFILSPEVQKGLSAITVYDIKGAVVTDSETEPSLLSGEVKSVYVRDQKPGVYIVKIVADRIYHLKFVKE